MLFKISFLLVKRIKIDSKKAGNPTKKFYINKKDSSVRNIYQELATQKRQSKYLLISFKISAYWL